MHKNVFLIYSLANALANPSFREALKKLGLDSGPGSDGKLPSSGRVARQASGDSACKQLREKWEMFNQTADAAVDGVQGNVNQTKSDEATEVLNSIKNE